MPTSCLLTDIGELAEVGDGLHLAAEEERHEPDDRRHLERLNNAEILREGGEE